MKLKFSVVFLFFWGENVKSLCLIRGGLARFVLRELQTKLSYSGDSVAENNKIVNPASGGSLNKDVTPPYWLLCDDLPAWFTPTRLPIWHATWLIDDEIPLIIKSSYGSDVPPIWLLNLDRLPTWFNEVEVLPDWLLAFEDMPPPSWVLRDSIPGCLRVGITSLMMNVKIHSLPLPQKFNLRLTSKINL
jgi:hypothetical protein